ncbi:MULTISPECIES: DUF4348 domain-containing protein [unclassified Duganella]|uniref:DUF4348 domain-containing protein n=1 Tax=unclassified Duganella TaxID=2636909 RepID=UPI0006F6DBA8|nr:MULTISPECIES: DUF4348 domain-containing protein [unclassified Duganella]KQV55397.1 hypothetical protein ASD07_28055 [Duganella sp. Root336D2]KRB95850.1 hypothetical protein ASE26_26195 [Duganella sp. Root198D2]
MTKYLAMMIAAAAMAGCATQTVPRGCSAEKFEDFLPRYMSDRQFAGERTVFPLESLDRADERKSLVTREQFAASTLLGDMIKADHLSIRQQANAGGMELNLLRPDSDSLTYFYRFRQQEGCWYLWQFEDSSL